MTAKMSEAERYLRKGLSEPNARPALGRSVRTNNQIVAWLKSLGPARSGWETSLMERLTKKLSK